MILFMTGRDETAPSARPPLLATAKIAVSAVVIAAIALGTFEIVDTDVFWHVKNGDQIIDTREILRVDEFSHTATGRPTIYYSWLAEVIAALLVRAGGFDLLVAAKAAACGLLVLLLAWAARVRGATGLALAWGLSWSLLLVRFRLYARPELFTLLALPLVDIMAVRLGAGRRWLLYVCFLFFAIWANLHPFVFLGIVILGLHTCGALIDRVRRNEAGAVDAPALAIATAVAFIASSFNPWRSEIFTPVFKLIDSSAIARTPTREWLAPTWDGFSLFFVLAAVATVVVLSGWRRRPTATILIWLTGLGLALVSQRNVGIFAVLGAPILARELTTLAAGAGRPLRALLPNLSDRLGPAVRVVAFLVVLAGATAIQIGPYSSVLHLDESRHYRFGLGIGPLSAPHRTVDFVAEHRLDGPLYNSWELGGWIIYRRWPDLKVALDGRQMIFEQFLGEIERKGLTRTLADHRIRLAIVSYLDGAGIAAVRASPDLALVAYDDLAMVFAHREQIVKRDLVALEIIRPEDLSLAWLPTEPAARATAIDEAARGAAPATARAKTIIGLIARRTGATGAALEALARAVELDPTQASYRNNLGVTLLDAGRAGEALRELDEAARLDARSFEALFNRGLAEAAVGQLRGARRSLVRALSLAADPASEQRVHDALTLLERP